MARPYRYEQLPDQHIRLLTLLPGYFEDEINLSLDSVSLDIHRPPNYHALSYTWGNPEIVNRVAIVVGHDRLPLKVTVNLYIALKHLRHISQSQTLWTDAICIDQQNLQERSAQVSRMAGIFPGRPRLSCRHVSLRFSSYA